MQAIQSICTIGAVPATLSAVLLLPGPTVENLRLYVRIDRMREGPLKTHAKVKLLGTCGQNEARLHVAGPPDWVMSVLDEFQTQPIYLSEDEVCEGCLERVGTTLYRETFQSVDVATWTCDACIASGRASAVLVSYRPTSRDDENDR